VRDAQWRKPNVPYIDLALLGTNSSCNCAMSFFLLYCLCNFHSAESASGMEDGPLTALAEGDLSNEERERERDNEHCRGGLNS
jgi:hypothetical protein